MSFVVSNQFGSIEYLSNDQEMVRQCVQDSFFEQHYVLRHLKDIVEKSFTIADVGAHCGSHTVLYKRINPSSAVYAFEPQKVIYNLLVKNVNRNDLKNVHCYNNAVGHFVGDAYLNDFSTDGSNSFESVSYDSEKMFNLAGIGIGSGGEHVKMITLDALAIDFDFIKIDVEGYEPYVLMGALQMIERCRPIINFESNHKVSDCKYTSFEILDSLGYKCEKHSVDNWIAFP